MLRLVTVFNSRLAFGRKVVAPGIPELDVIGLGIVTEDGINVVVSPAGHLLAALRRSDAHRGRHQSTSGQGFRNHLAQFFQPVTSLFLVTRWVPTGLMPSEHADDRGR